MAQAYRKEKIEKLYEQIKTLSDFESRSIKDSTGGGELLKYIQGRKDAYDLILNMLEKDFNLTAE